MHIILAFLGLVITLLMLLNKLQQNGLDIGWLNPFSWHRRRTYRIKHDRHPAFKLESPMDVVALCMVAVAKIDGDLSTEQKVAILSLFQLEFHLCEKQAHALLSSSVHLLGANEEVLSCPQKLFDRAYDKFQPVQSRSLVLLIDQVGDIEGACSKQQRSLINKIKQACPSDGKQKW
jgi:hypothetical protein